MKEAAESSRLIRFESFEVNLRSGELRRAGEKVRLPEQSFQILAMLLERPGEVVMRQEIQKRLWPNDTVVEFENSINAAVKRLRLALEDSADEPRYVETLARRGYRWMVPIEWVGVNPETPQDAVPAAAESRPAESTASNLIGKKVSHYRVLEILGGGGMGVVYKAEDLKLGRRVALKFLPEETASDPLTLHRFKQEARATSALNHPNICTIYEIEEHEGQPFIVMELLEGETLRELISAATTRTAPPPLEKLLDLAVQITEGLEAAHYKGIIHRDLKPANVFVTTQGQAKILDFGLAKLVPVLAPAESYPGREPRTDDVHGTPGETALAPGSDLFLSRSGVAMGTAGYMSPEQVRGETLDARTDLFSFGLVLYEMAAGQRAFSGETAPILHDAILSHTPTPVRELNPEIPPKLEAIINKALEKEPELRYQSASEIHGDLKSLRQDIQPRHTAVPWWGVAAGVLVLLGLIWLVFHQPSTQNALSELKQRQLTNNSSEDAVEGGSISPDGKYLAYSDANGIKIRLIETGETRAVPRPNELKDQVVDWGVRSWFPDGTRFLVNAVPRGIPPPEVGSKGTSIWIVSLLGGAPHKLRDNVFAYSVSPDGSSISFGTNWGGEGDREIWLMGPTGDQARKLYDTDKDSRIGELVWSPDGKLTLYTRTDKTGSSLIIRGLRGGSSTALFPRSTADTIFDYLWSPDGRLIYSLLEPGTDATCNLWEMRLDGRTGRPIEQPRRLTSWSDFCMTFAGITANSEKLAYLKWTRHSTTYVADLDASGSYISNPRHLPSERSDTAMDWTADSKAVIVSSSQSGIDKQSLSEESPEPIEAPQGGARDLRVSPDGKWVLYFPSERISDKNPQPVMRVPIDGGPSQQVFIAKANSRLTCAKSPSDLCAIAEPTEDRKQVIITAFDPLKGRGSELTRFDLDPNSDYWAVEVSPDGTRIAAFRSPAGPIYILSLRGQPAQEVRVKGWSNLKSLNWTANGKGLFVGSDNDRPEGAALLHVDLQGNASILWKQLLAAGVAPSPDGGHLAFSGNTSDTNIWMIENFQKTGR